MTKAVHIPSRVAEAVRAPLDQLDIAPENLRATERADPDIAALAETIAAADLLYPLLVRPGRAGEAAYMVLDGRRRLMALRALVDSGRAAADRPVRVEVAQTKAEQAAAIVISNTQRAPVHVADVIIAIGKLRALKMAPAKIAAALGYPEIEVRRLQRLAALPKPVLEALKAGRINLRTAKLLARVTDAEALTAFTQNAAAGCLSEYAISNHLRGRPGLDDPMFDLIGVERYRAAGGRIDADLFGEFDDVVLDPDKLQGLWAGRVSGLIDAAKDRGLAVYLQGGPLYRAPEGLEVAGHNTAAGLAEEARLAFDLACRRTDALAQALATGDRHSESRDGDLVAFLLARLDQESRLHGVERLAAVGLFPEAGTGFDVQAYLTPAGSDPDADRSGGDDPDEASAAGGERAWEADFRPKIVVPEHEIDAAGRSHSLHEAYTDIATRGLIRSVADDPLAALTLAVARLFALLALQDSPATDQSASTLLGRRYSPGSRPAEPALDGVVRGRLDAKRRAYLDSGLRPISWVDTLPHGEKMELLAELIAISLDLREPNPQGLRRAARAEAAEIAELTGHDISAYWTPDVAFLAQHTKAQLLHALAGMEADATLAKGLKKDELVGLVAATAAERGWVPPTLNLRLKTAAAAEPEPAKSGGQMSEVDPLFDGDDPPGAGDGEVCATAT